MPNSSRRLEELVRLKQWVTKSRRLWGFEQSGVVGKMVAKYKARLDKVNEKLTRRILAH